MELLDLFPRTFRTPRDLFLHELRELYSAEAQLAEALPRMIEAALSPQLKAVFSEHLLQTETHVSRLQTIFRSLEEDPRGETYGAMQQLLAQPAAEEGSRDERLIDTAQRAEHFQVAAYDSLNALARRLGEGATADLLRLSREEEGAADLQLAAIAAGETITLPAGAAALTPATGIFDRSRRSEFAGPRSRGSRRR